MDDVAESQTASLEAEQAVLGALLCSPDTFHDLPSELQPSHFYRNPHEILFRAISGMQDFGESIDLVTLTERLRSDGNLDAAGGTSYVSGLAEKALSLGSVGRYAGIVIERAHRRALVHACSEVIRGAQDETVRTLDLESALEKSLLDVSAGEGTRRTSSAEAVDKMLVAAERARTEGAVRGIETGIAAVDRDVWINPTDLVVIGARPGTGKSILLHQISREIAKTRPVLFVNLEMDDSELVQRAATDTSGLSIGEIREPKSDAAWLRLKSAATGLRKSKIEYYPEPDPRRVFREARRMIRKGGLGAIVWDYIQIAKFPSESGEKRYEQIGWLTRSMKAFAREHRVPVIPASQLRRLDFLARGQTSRPTMDHLRESGDIENDANCILLIHVPGTVPGTKQHKAGDVRTAEICVEKVRGGRSFFSIPVVADFPHGRFNDPSAEEAV